MIDYDMTNEAYHSLPALGSSGIRALLRSPAHYYGTTLDPNRPVRDDSRFLAGTLAHCCVLEPSQFGKRYIVKPEGMDGRTKEGKAWAASVAPGMTIISDDQAMTAWRQAASILRLPEIAELINGARTEVSAFWQDAATGVDCKCRPDWLSEVGSGVIIPDLKTTQDASPEGFAKSVARYGYHIQASHYSDGFERASGRQVLGFIFVCVEADYPHAAAAYMLDDEAMEKGRDEVKRALALYAECKASGVWPGYPNTIQPLSLPHWAL